MGLFKHIKQDFQKIQNFERKVFKKTGKGLLKIGKVVGKEVGYQFKKRYIEKDKDGHHHLNIGQVVRDVEGGIDVVGHFYGRGSTFNKVQKVSKSVSKFTKNRQRPRYVKPTYTPKTKIVYRNKYNRFNDNMYNTYNKNQYRYSKRTYRKRNYRKKRYYKKRYYKKRYYKKRY